MAQASYAYACARISALSKRLLDTATVWRMAEGSLDDAMRVLQDMRYGGAQDGAVLVAHGLEGCRVVGGGVA